VNLLWPRHDAAAHKWALEWSVVAKNLGSVVTSPQIRFHFKLSKFAATYFAEDGAIFGSMQQSSLVLEHIVGPRLVGIHVVRERPNIVFVAFHADAQILQT